MAGYKKYRKPVRRYKRRQTKALSLPRIRRAVYSTQEEKYFEYSRAPFAITNTWQFQSALVPNDTVSGIAQGPGVNQRIGNKIFVKSIQYNFMISGIIANFDMNGVMSRVVMYKNNDPNGVLPVPAQVFNSATDIMAQRFRPRIKLINILKDRMDNFVVTATDSAGLPKAVGPRVCFSFTLYPKKVINYQTSSGILLTDLQDIDYGFGFVASDGNGLNIEYNLCIKYTDA